MGTPEASYMVGAAMTWRIGDDPDAPPKTAPVVIDGDLIDAIREETQSNKISTLATIIIQEWMENKK